MTKPRKAAPKPPPAPRLLGWLSHDLLRYGGQAAAIAAVLGVLSLIFPTARDLVNSDPPPLIGKRTFDPVAQAVQSIQKAQTDFVGRLNEFDIGQMQRECTTLADRKEALELRRRMSGDDRLVRETLDQVTRGMARLQRQIEAAGQIPDCR